MHNCKILLVQLFSNGDCLYATTVARQIKIDYPGCELTWAVADFCAQIIENNPYVDVIRKVTDVPKSDVVAFRKFKKKVIAEKAAGEWNEVFITTNMDNNLALYDGTIRGMILHAYPHRITVPIQPVLVLSGEEITKVEKFADLHKLQSFQHVILWEYAPQSGQSSVHFDVVFRIATAITKKYNAAFVLSSATKFNETNTIFDGSVLTVRENAALTHYCDFLIGCSSGISWINTSSAGAFIPMLQLLNGDAAFMNAPSVDFTTFHIDDSRLIEMYHFDEKKIMDCVDVILSDNFSTAKAKFNQSAPLQFNTTSKVVYNMLCYLQFRAVFKHMHLNIKRHGMHPALFKQFFLAILSFPFKLVRNLYRKRIKFNY